MAEVTRPLDDMGLVNIDNWPDDNWDALRFTRADDGLVCDACGGPVVAEHFSVPCCGGEFTCTDDNTRYRCDSCRTVAHAW